MFNTSEFLIGELPSGEIRLGAKSSEWRREKKEKEKETEERVRTFQMSKESPSKWKYFRLQIDTNEVDR